MERSKLLRLLPKPVQAKLENDVGWIIEEAGVYGFTEYDIVPCIMAALYAVETTAEEEEPMRLFPVAFRSALKLLSYAKFGAVRDESGWMRYRF